LAAGIFPDAIAPSIDGLAPRSLAVLPCVAVGQAAYVLLIWPLAVAGSRRPAGRQLAVALALSLPAWILAGVMSDAVVVDVARAAIYILLLLPLAIAAADLLSGPAMRQMTLLGLFVVLLGLPAGYYIVREFVAASPLGPVERIWQAGPLTAVWGIAAPRSGGWFPQPMWAAVVWPALGILLLVVRLAIGRGSQAGETA